MQETLPQIKSFGNKYDKKPSGLSPIIGKFSGEVGRLATSSRRDFYLDHPSQMPKADIGEYIRSNGILVPKIFKDLKQVYSYIRDGGTIIMRSEHPQDYSGISGILDSILLSKGERGLKIGGAHLKIPNIGDFNQKEFERGFKFPTDNIKQYCAYVGIDVKYFLEEISFSYWEYLGGYNRSITADTGIPGRYHITSNSKGFSNYTIVENGIIMHNIGDNLPTSLEEGLNDTINFYENIRTLEKFNPNNCPLIEFQTMLGRNYFLQYLKTRDINYSSFKIDRDLEKSEIKATIIRGVTPPEGLEMELNIIYPQMESSDNSCNGVLKIWRSGIKDEIEFNGKKLVIDVCNPSQLASDLSNGHTSRSAIFKPEISVIISFSDLDLDLIRKIRDDSIANGTIPKIKVRIISDGKNAYLKFYK